MCRVTCPLLPGFSTTAAIIHLHPVRITGFGCGSFRFSASLSCRVLAMWPPFRVEFVSVLDWNEDSSRTFPRGWCRAFAMGSPVSGRVAYVCALDRYNGFLYPSILSCFAMGSPYGFLLLDCPIVFFGFLVCIPSGWGHPFRV